MWEMIPSVARTVRVASSFDRVSASRDEMGCMCVGRGAVILAIRPRRAASEKQRMAVSKITEGDSSR